jgi:hypothetical protein
VFARVTSKKTNTLASTHLVCPTTDNEKFRAAVNWNTPVVVAEWVVDSFKSQKMMDAKLYNPELRTDSDSESQGSCVMPRTPYRMYSRSTGLTGTTNALSNYPASISRKPVSRKVGGAVFSGEQEDSSSPFKVPRPPMESMNEDPAGDDGDELTKSFLAWQEARKLKGDDDDGSEESDIIEKETTESFLKWAAEQKAIQGDSPKKDVSIDIPGYTTDEARRLRAGLELMGANSPAPMQSKRRNSTPKSEMMRRTWKALMEKFPMDHIHPLTSTPKAQASTPVEKVASANPCSVCVHSHSFLNKLCLISSGVIFLWLPNLFVCPIGKQR